MRLLQPVPTESSVTFQQMPSLNKEKTIKIRGGIDIFHG